MVLIATFRQPVDNEATDLAQHTTRDVTWALCRDNEAQPELPALFRDQFERLGTDTSLILAKGPTKELMRLVDGDHERVRSQFSGSRHVEQAIPNSVHCDLSQVVGLRKLTHVDPEDSGGV